MLLGAPIATPLESETVAPGPSWLPASVAKEAKGELPLVSMNETKRLSLPEVSSRSSAAASTVPRGWPAGSS